MTHGIAVELLRTALVCLFIRKKLMYNCLWLLVLMVAFLSQRPCVHHRESHVWAAEGLHPKADVWGRYTGSPRKQGHRKRNVSSAEKFVRIRRDKNLMHVGKCWSEWICCMSISFSFRIKAYRKNVLAKCVSRRLFSSVILVKNVPWMFWINCFPCFRSTEGT